MLKMVMAALLVASAVPAGAQAVAADDPERAELGRRLAASGDFQAIIGAAAAAETASLAAEHKELSEAERAALQALAKERFEAVRAPLLDKVGAIYAEQFTLEELRAIVAFFESDAGRAYTGRLTRTMPAIAAAMQGLDFKADVRAAFCARNGKLCEQKE